MSRTHDSLAYALRQRALDGIQGNATSAAYRRAVRRFAAWGKDQGIKTLDAVTEDVLQRYTDDMIDDPRSYSAATIHAYLAPLCKAAGVPMERIRKPRRRSGTITRGRRADANPQGRRELDSPRYARLVTLQRALGIRRAELARLTGADLIEHGSQLYVHVRRGKGGKDQMQWVLPDDRETVRQIWAGVAPDQRVIDPMEMRCKVSLHTIRADHAQRAYDYFVRLQSDQDHADQLRNVLLHRWEQGHQQLKADNPAAYAHQRQRFAADCSDEPYKLRGDNRRKAIKQGKPEVYNRLALMAVSVCELSHWRLDVTVTNYLI